VCREVSREVCVAGVAERFRERSVLPRVCVCCERCVLPRGVCRWCVLPRGLCCREVFVAVSLVSSGRGCERGVCCRDRWSWLERSRAPRSQGEVESAKIAGRGKLFDLVSNIFANFRIEYVEYFRKFSHRIFADILQIFANYMLIFICGPNKPCSNLCITA
jgi:hypothetical protein